MLNPLKSKPPKQKAALVKERGWIGVGNRNFAIRSPVTRIFT
jgi:hypothetical protein